MEKIEKLKNDIKVTIRKLNSDDLGKLMAFYSVLPEEDRKYLRVDVTDRDVVAQRIGFIEKGNIIRIIALYKKKIVADGALELFSDEWEKHHGELRVIVAQDFQRRGLGSLIMRELYFLAVQKKIETLVVKMMRPQTAARSICRRLGFHEEAIVPDYVRDMTGTAQDMVVMTCDMQEFWKELEDSNLDSDWQKRR